ncbi:hypothetical protein ACIQMR_26730 [Streptomyces sp. NPDC091376]|uniref:hypothetical protein n=1 Tax=Streptomyces sp. NPDC091376 TaxID=3365994 RepID=UPI003817DEF1
MRAESSSAARTGAFTAVTAAPWHARAGFLAPRRVSPGVAREPGAAALWALRACPRSASGEGGP